MYRLLIVDDEEIITQTLYEVFNQSMQEELDVYKAFSAKEALDWMSRTRIDIVLSDIRMPGMSGLELMEKIHTYWPRCRVVFLTGYSEFEYAYQALQKANVKYLLKTEGYNKVMQTIQEVIDEIKYDHQINHLLKQSVEQKDALVSIAQGEYFRQVILDGYDESVERSLEMLEHEFKHFDINLRADERVLIVLGRFAYTTDLSYLQKVDNLSLVRQIWDSFMSDQINSTAVIDKHGDLIWFLQPSMQAGQMLGGRITTYVEGTLELIQQACQATLGVDLSFTMSGKPCNWEQVSSQYEALRQLQRMHISEGIPVIQVAHSLTLSCSSSSEGFRIGPKVEMMTLHLEAGRIKEFMESFEEIESYTLNHNDSALRSMEVYYSLSLMMLSYMNRYQLNEQLTDMNKLMRLDAHASMKEGFRYIRLIAEKIFSNKHSDDRDRASSVIGKICNYIHEHLSEDLSLVRLAEVHYFNPSYLSRLFKQEKGVKLSEYIDECRLRRAKELLGNADLKIREVALQVGYEAAHSFTRFFKKATGMTPQEYRDL